MAPARALAGAAPRLLPLGLLLAVACAVTPEEPARLPPSAAVHPENLLERLATEEAAVRTVHGLATVRYEGAAGGGSASQVVVLALPDRARLEVLNPMGTAVLLLVIRGEDLALHSLVRREYGAGRATRETLGRLIRISIPPGTLLRLLAGLSPLPVRPDDPRTKVVPEERAIRVESVDGPFWQRLWTGPDGTSLAGGELWEASGLLLRFQFSNRKHLAGIPFPSLVTLESAGEGTRVTIRYETVRLNGPVEADLFELPRPADPDTRILDLSRAGLRQESRIDGRASHPLPGQDQPVSRDRRPPHRRLPRDRDRDAAGGSV